MPNIALAPEVTRRRMYYETMERVLQQVDKTIVEAPGVTPYLPLPESSARQARRRPKERQRDDAGCSATRSRSASPRSCC